MYKTGMIFRSQTHPQFDLVIDFVVYNFNDKGKVEKYGTFVSWCNINMDEFIKFVDEKLGKNRADKSTFPYACWGECNTDSMRARIKKYNLEYCGMSDDEVTIYNDSEYEYCSGFKK